jgi:hypothetical protein
MNVTVRYAAVDGFRQTRKFKTLAGAQRFAQKWVGETPEVCRHYAVSGDGVGKVTVEGCLIDQLFPKGLVGPAQERDCDDDHMY